jgi:ketosteroid isomerase-like protein
MTDCSRDYERAMSQENVEAVRSAFEQYARGDFSAFADLPDDFEFVASSEMPDAGTYRGEAARRWLKSWVASFEQLTIEATEIIDAGDTVFVAMIQRGRPRGSRTVVEGRWWQAVRFRGREVAWIETFPERAQALEAAGLQE